MGSDRTCGNGTRRTCRVSNKHLCSGGQYGEIVYSQTTLGDTNIITTEEGMRRRLALFVTTMNGILMSQLRRASS